jgi:16S rRNA (guanine(966)-N(2))-methyltransferase RsmD
MRITGGTLAGRNVAVPEGVIRPAMDRMRESVFAVLGDLTGKSFLDLFSGSGIIALEAASRGAEHIEAVEMDRVKRKTILQNVSLSPVRINCRFISVELYVQRAKRSFDYVFCDPPFPYQFKWELAANVAASPLLAGESLFLLHRPREDFCDAGVPGLVLKARRIYGRSVVEFFEKKKHAS